jgi:16S rRNA (guanine527-N7)-methyltransferase
MATDTLALSLREQLDAGLQQTSLSVSDSQRTKLVDYVLLLSKWNKTHNLTAIKSPAEMITRHVLDSLSISPYVTAGALLDVGAGAGLPGIPLAVTRDDISVTLVDSVNKKTQFMAFAATALGLANVTVQHSRIENLSVENQFPMVTARAFADIGKLCELTRGYVLPGGRILAMVGRVPEHEQMESFQQIAGFSLERIEKLLVPGEQAQRNLVILTRCSEQ